MLIRKRKELNKSSSIVERINLTNVQYNACVEQYPNTQALLLDGEELINLQFRKGNCINPKAGLFAKKRKDSKSYKLYFIDNSFYPGSYTLEFSFDDPITEGIRERITVHTSFVYHVACGELALKLLNGDKDSYSAAFFLKRIQPKLDNCMRRYILKSMLTKGYIETNQSLYSLSKTIEETLNSEVLNEYGIQINNLNIKLEEEKRHFNRRNTLNWKILEKEKLYVSSK